jgi:hypothetical protein
MSYDNNAAIDAVQIDEDVLSYTVSDEALEAATNRDQTDEDILTYTASDEALEAAVECVWSHIPSVIPQCP